LHAHDRPCPFAVSVVERSAHAGPGFDFDLAARIFDAPVLEWLDNRSVYGEKRIQAIGSAEGAILFVVCTDRGDIRRIISALAPTRRNVSYGCRSQIDRADARR
jgi:uncharacterized DUF497 family protein